MESKFAVPGGALQCELDRLNSLRRTVVLCEGERIGTFAAWNYYRFEIPEEVLFRTTGRAVFTVGHKHSFDIPGIVIEADNQFITIALPHDFGPFIPEIRCLPNYEAELRPILDILSRPDCNTPLTSFLLKPNPAENSHFVGFEQPHFPADSNPHQCEAVRNILDNKVTLLWGPVSSGKTYVVGLAAANYLLMGKSVLLVAPANDYADDAFLKTVSQGIALNLPMETIACRFGLPSAGLFKETAPYSFSRQVEQLRNEKRKVFQERTALLKTYWHVREQQAIHEDFYSRIQSLRARGEDLRRRTNRIDQEIEQWTDVINKRENASFLDRVKIGFSDDDLQGAQQRLASIREQKKQILSFEQTIANDITTTELEAPVSAAEWKSYRETLRSIEELGGIEAVTQSVEEFITVDEPALLGTKRLIAANVATALMEPNIRSRRYDMVIVEEAQRVNIPTLIALASLAKEKVVLAGDPFQVEPDSVTNTESARHWLQTDIFLHAAQTKELHRLFDWSKKNHQWSIQLRTLYAGTPQTSTYMASVLYDKTIDVVLPANPKGKIYFVDTSELRTKCTQYVGKKKILPYNEQQTKAVLECAAHALVEARRSADEIGIIVPFTGPTLYTKLQARLYGMHNIEIGTPQSFCDRRKPAIIFDTTMAGVNYTMRALDDKKVGEHRIIRLLNTILSCVSEDLYIVVDVAHFRKVYKDRLFMRLLMLLRLNADEQSASFGNAMIKFETLDIGNYADMLSFGKKRIRRPAPEKSAAVKEDHEFALQMKMMAAKQQDSLPLLQAKTAERETYHAVCRALGYRTDINLLAQCTGNAPLMKSSPLSRSAAQHLPFEVCENKKSLRTVLERWDLLLSPAAGAGESPYFSDKTPEARIRFDVHRLFAFYASDIETVLQEGKQKMAFDASRLFQELIGKSQPGTPSEWSAAYLALLVRIEAYLGWISEQIRR
jgi:hypothetical protein